MATYLSNYKHDVFVSYAHVNNKEFPNVDKGWVSMLVEYLNIQATEQLTKFEPFMDYVLPPNKPFPDEILNAIKQSATLIIILSPAYLKSEWCDKERNEFLEIVKQQKDTGRIFIVEHSPVSHTKKPQELQKLLPIRFWVKGEEGKPPRTLGHPEILLQDKYLYYDRLNYLVHQLTQTLENIEEQENHIILPSQPPRSDVNAIPQKSESPRPAVFLAETTDDLYDKWFEIKNYLDQQNFEVLPKTSIYAHYLTDPTASEQMLDGELKKCRVFVQLVSGIIGRKIRGQVSFPRLQYDHAVNLNKTIFQWRDPELNLNHISDNDQRDLVEKARPINFESFKRGVVEKVKALKHLPLGTCVFFDTDNTDRNLGIKIGDIIKEDYGIIYFLPPEENQTEAEVEKAKNFIEDLKNSVECCDGLMVVYGKANYYLVRRRFKNIAHILQSVRKRPKAIACYKGPPPENKRELGIVLPAMITIDASNDSNIEREKLQLFLEKLTEGENL